MSVPASEVRVGRYYRTTFGKRPAVVKAVTDVLAHSGRVGCVDQKTGQLRYLRPERLFNEVVQLGDGSGRWTQVDWRTR